MVGRQVETMASAHETLEPVAVPEDEADIDLAFRSM